MSIFSTLTPDSHLQFLVVVTVTRTFDWLLVGAPPRVTPASAKGPRSTTMDALDLALTMRDSGRDRSRRVFIPCETRSTSHGRFTSYVTLSTFIHALIFAILQKAILSVSSMRLGAISGGSVFDETLPAPIECHHGWNDRYLSHFH